MPFSISMLQHPDLAAFDAHFMRHRAESGRGDIHFMPFAPDDQEGPQGLDARLLNLAITEPGWQRWWIARTTADDQVIGHVDLKGGRLRTASHRCELGIGIERDYRGQGLGEQLMQAALEFARATPALDYVDLRVFAHNHNARALYRKLGFVEVGTVHDFVRVGSTKIDDVLMVLEVANNHQ